MICFMKEKQDVVAAATQGVAFGFEKGFESAVEYLRMIAAKLPDDVQKTVAVALAGGLESFSADARGKFLKRIQIVAIEKTSDAHTRIQ